jgi:hypothetical protein
MIRKLIILMINQDLLIMPNYSRNGFFAWFVKVRATALD